MAINPYTTSTVSCPEYNQLICGRKENIIDLIRLLSEPPYSVALFGERRIGKTSLLYLLKDVIDEEINNYKQKMVDGNLKITEIKIPESMKNCRVIYKTVQSLSSDSYLNNLLSSLSKDLNINGNFNSLLELFKEVNNSLEANQRFVLLLDEIDILSELDNSKEIFEDFKAVIEKFSKKISFLFAGSFLFYKKIKNKILPVYNVVKNFHLKAPEKNSIENYLIRSLLKNCLNNKPLDEAVTTIIDWTNYKPYYVQSICSKVFYLAEDKSLPEDWVSDLEEELVDYDLYPTLKLFYEEFTDEPARKILILLAHNNNLSFDEIVKKLNYGKEEISSNLNDLELFNKIFNKDNKYYISGSLIAKYGRDYKEGNCLAM